MTIAEDLKQSVKALVCHEMDIVHEGDWFKDFVKGIVDESLMENRWLDVLEESEWFSNLVEGIVTSKLNEIQGSEKDSDDFQKLQAHIFLSDGVKDMLPAFQKFYSLIR